MSTLVRELDRHGASRRTGSFAQPRRPALPPAASSGLGPGHTVAALEAEYAGLTGTRVVSSYDD